jgi:hypothetical protein
LTYNINQFLKEFFFEKLNGEEKLNAEKKKKMEVFKREKSQVNFSFQTGRRSFNIFLTLSDYCGGSGNLLYIVIFYSYIFIFP